MQQTTLWAATLRLKRSSTWIMSSDIDEYLTPPSDVPAASVLQLAVVRVAAVAVAPSQRAG